MDWQHPIIADLVDVLPDSKLREHYGTERDPRCAAMINERAQCDKCWQTTRPADNPAGFVKLCWAHAKQVDDYRKTSND